MANNHSTLTGLFTDIADAIRAKGGGGGDTLTWDGSISDQMYVNFGEGVYLVKISDAIPSIEDFTSGGVVKKSNNETIIFTADGIGHVTDNIIMDNEGLFVIVLQDNANLGDSYVFQEKGFYVGYSDEYYISSVTINGYTGFASKIVADNFPEAINAIETCPEDALFLNTKANPIRIEGAQGEYVATAYGNGKFVAMDCNSGNTMYSTDGITWVHGTSSINGAWMSVVYGCNKFVAVSAHDKYQIAYSIDGITWTMTTAPNPAEMILVGFTTITYVDNRFIAYCVCYDADNNVVPAVAYSTDGISWQTTALSIPSFIEKVTYGNEKFVGIFMQGADGGATNISVYSVDGITWETATLPISAYWRFVAYGNGKFVAIPFCDANMEDTNVIAYSNDGISWESATLPITDDWVSVTYGKDKFVIVGKSTAVYSTDGITWTEITMPNSVLSGEGFWQQIIYGNNMFVVLSSSFYDKALNNSVVAVAISEDGINWTATITNAAITNVSGTDVTEETVQATGILDDELATQDDLIAQIYDALESKLYVFINFTVDGVSYKAREGMTWGEWIDSKYNTGGFYVYSYDPDEPDDYKFVALPIVEDGVTYPQYVLYRGSGNVRGETINKEIEANHGYYAFTFCA